MKIGPKLSDPTTFGDPTPYNIMFGPDKCGYTKRTHLIFNYKGKNVLKKSDLAYKQEGEGTSHVYRLLLKPDNTARVEIDGEKIYEGSLKEDWELLAPKEIKDPEDKKPSDWVDDSMMDDPEAGGGGGHFSTREQGHLPTKGVCSFRNSPQFLGFWVFGSLGFSVCFLVSGSLGFMVSGSLDFLVSWFLGLLVFLGFLVFLLAEFLVFDLYKSDPMVSTFYALMLVSLRFRRCFVGVVKIII